MLGVPILTKTPALPLSPAGLSPCLSGSSSHGCVQGKKSLLLPIQELLCGDVDMPLHQLMSPAHYPHHGVLQGELSCLWLLLGELW